MRALFILCTVLLAVLFYGAEANEENFPRDQSSTSQFPSHPLEESPIVHGDRHRRVTCDLLSFDTKWGSINHAACAAHCLAMFKGYRGGHCDGNGVCICRK